MSDRDMAQSGSKPDDGAIRRNVTIVNQRGLHARAAARFAKLAETFSADVTVSANGLVVSALSIMGLMLLAAGPGTTVEIYATGAEADAAILELVALVKARFDED